MGQSLVGITLKGRYEIINQLGAGGFGDTYLAYDRDLPGSPKRVVKHLSPKGLDPQGFTIAERLFKQEAELLYKLGEQHDQIPFLHAYFQEDGQFYLVQEFIKGHDLTEEIPSGQKFSEDKTLKLLDEILTVLSFVHENGVIHRDIKPQNIMRRERDGKLFLIDFGAVKEINAMTTDVTGQTSLTVGIGSPGFMPNEQANGRPKLSSDVYAVGMIAVNCLTGIHPSQLQEDTQTGELLWQHLAQVSERTGQFIQTMVNDHFRTRFQTATVAHRALSSLRMSKPASELGQAVNEPVESTIVYESTPSSVPSMDVNQTIEPSSVPPSRPPSQPIQTRDTSPSQSRRGFLTFLGLGGLGIGGALLYGTFLNGKTPSTTGKDPKGIPAERENALSLPIQEFSFSTIRVDERGDVVERIDGSADYFEEDLGKGVTLDMIIIPGGTFIMGAPSSEQESEDNERPQREVKVPSFAMGRYPVTQLQWIEIMGENPSNFKGDRRPVERVNWTDAVEFCQKLSERTNREYRLPSEAEWEYACRAGTTVPFYFGESITSELVNFDGTKAYAQASVGEYREQTTDVDSFPPNTFGLYDMHGNVYEWCEDTWHDNYQGAPQDGSAWISDDKRRVLRGGSWDDYPWGCRSANRFRNNLDVRHDNYGLRVAFVLPSNP